MEFPDLPMSSRATVERWPGLQVVVDVVLCVRELWALCLPVFHHVRLSSGSRHAWFAFGFLKAPFHRGYGVDGKS